MPDDGLKKRVFRMGEIDSPYWTPPRDVLDFGGLSMAGGRVANVEYMNHIYGRLRDAGMDDVHAAVVLGTIANESGGDPFALSPDGRFYGLMQWASDRYEPNMFDDGDAYGEIDRQLDYFMATAGDPTDGASWTHGGEGSGYMTARDAMEAWRAEQIYLMMHPGPVIPDRVASHEP